MDVNLRYKGFWLEYNKEFASDLESVYGITIENLFYRLVDAHIKYSIDRIIIPCKYNPDIYTFYGELKYLWNDDESLLICSIRILKALNEGVIL